MILFSLLVASASAARVLGRIGCDGGIDVLEGVLANGAAMSLRFNGFTPLAQWLESEQTANHGSSCMCSPALSESELNDFVRQWNPQWLLNKALGKGAKTFSRCGVSSVNDGPLVDLGSTCNYDKYMQTGQCIIEAKRSVAGSDFALRLRVEKCDSSSFPFMELTCEGADCTYFMSPCGENSDCQGGSMSCLQLTDSAGQCAEAKCAMSSYSVQTQYTKVGNDKCSSGKVSPPTTGCDLNGRIYGEGFQYYYDDADKGRATTPTKESDIQMCVGLKCVRNGGSFAWEPLSYASNYDCFETLTIMLPATGDYCKSAGERVKNPIWPFSSRNTCNWREIVPHGDLAQYGVDVGRLEAFFVGSTRFVSDVEQGLGSMLNYDEVDTNANPFGCQTNEQMMNQMKQRISNMFRRQANLSPLALAQSSKMGMCMPVSDITLEANDNNRNNQQSFSTSSSGWQTSYSPSIPSSLMPALYVKEKVGFDCDVVDMPNGPSTFRCANDLLKKDLPKYSAAQRFDGASARKVRTVKPITTGAVVMGHLNCAGSMVLLPNHATAGMELSVEAAVEAFIYMRDMIKSGYNCRARTHGASGDLSDREFNTRWITFYNVLYFLTSPVSTMTAVGTAFRDLRSRVSDRMAGERVSMPSTCTFDRFVKDGQCTVQFTGLSQAEFFDRQTDINLMVSVCPGSFIPEIYAECVGVGCSVFNVPKPCSADAECGVSGKCYDLSKISESSSSSSRSYTALFAFPDSPKAVDSTSFTGLTPRISFSSQYTAAQAAISKPAFTLDNIDISQSRITVNVDVAGTYRVFTGTYSGKFPESEITVSIRGCDEDKHTVAYGADYIEFVATCDCKLRARSVKSSSIVKSLTAGLKSFADMFESAAVSNNNHVKRQNNDGNDGSGSSGNALLGFYNGCSPESVETTKISARALHAIGGIADTGKTTFCFFDATRKDASGDLLLAKWAKNQVSISGDVIQLVNLKPWGESSPILPPDGGSSINSVSWRVKEGDAGVDKFVDSTLFLVKPMQTRPMMMMSGVAPLSLAVVGPIVAALAVLFWF